MNLLSNGKQLLGSTRDLARKWDETKVEWRDAKSLEFEREHLQHLFTTVERAMPVFEQLEKIMVKVSRDCE